MDQNLGKAKLRTNNRDHRYWPIYGKSKRYNFTFLNLKVEVFNMEQNSGEAKCIAFLLEQKIVFF